MRYVQTIAVRTTDGARLADMMNEWHEAEAGVAPGYQSSRLLADRDNPGRYVLVVEFSSAEEADLNNDRPETNEWGAKLGAVIEGDPEFGNYDEANVTG